DQHIEASQAEYNIRNQTGQFHNVVGTIGLQKPMRHMILTSTNPFAFTGKLVEKNGPDHYIVHDGTVTSCELPHPKWQFNAHRVVMELGHNAVIYRSTFRIRGVRSEEHTSELQSRENLVCRLLLEKKNK